MIYLFPYIESCIPFCIWSNIGTNQWLALGLAVEATKDTGISACSFIFTQQMCLEGGWCGLAACCFSYSSRNEDAAFILYTFISLCRVMFKPGCLDKSLNPYNSCYIFTPQMVRFWMDLDLLFFAEIELTHIQIYFTCIAQEWFVCISYGANSFNSIFLCSLLTCLGYRKVQ